MKTYKLLLFFILIIFNGCGEDNTEITEGDGVYTPIDLQQYVNSFEAKLRYSVGNLNVTFVADLGLSSIGGDILGRCTTSSNSIPFIEIDEGQFYDLSSVQREVLMYHELAHCVLYFSHNNSLRGDGCPISIMYERVLNTECYNAHYVEYMDDLFNR